MLSKLTKTLGVGLALGALFATPAAAGPYIFAGTDADDHGGASSTGNIDGWLFMQKAIENLGGGVTNGNKVVVSLGSDPNSQAGDAAASAFNFSSLAATGYTFLNVNGAAAISSFFLSGISSAAIIMLDSGENVVGGLDFTEQSVLTANATTLNDFLGNGGGLFSQANEYGFLSTLVPGLSTSASGQQGIQLTSAGTAAFPALTNGDLSAGPYHQTFNNVGSIPVLAVGQFDGGLSVIIGAAGGTITNPTNPGTSVPEPGTMALLGGVALAGIALRRRQRS